jgi:importin subunit alpha-6/7
MFYSSLCSFRWASSPALQAIENISTGNHRILAAVMAEDPFPSLRDLLASPDDTIRATACRAVQIIIASAGGELRIQEAADQNLVPCLVRCLGDAALQVRRIAARVVFCIANIGTFEQTELLVQEGCVPALCDVLESGPGNEDALPFVLRAIKDILYVGDRLVGAEAHANPMVPLVRAAGGVPKLQGLLRQHDVDDDTRYHATDILETYFPAEDDGEEEHDGAASLAASSGTDGDERDGGDTTERDGKRPRTS